jgi:NAD(P)-dependent dehydrogenase (short-subunit alcohol dehydrogenase family)
MTNATAIVIGVGPGLGRALAHAFARAGHPVAVIARNSHSVKTLVTELNQTGAQAQGYAADAGNPDQLRAVIHSAAGDLGAPEVLVYNAAVLRADTPTDGDTTGWATAMAVDVLGAKVAAESVLPLLRGGRGSLLFTGGGLAAAPSPEYASLSVGKAALRAYVAALHLQLKASGVRATSVRIGGHINGGEARFAADALADRYLGLHNDHPDTWVDELIVD